MVNQGPIKRNRITALPGFLLAHDASIPFFVIVAHSITTVYIAIGITYFEDVGVSGSYMPYLLASEMVGHINVTGKIANLRIFNIDHFLMIF